MSNFEMSSNQSFWLPYMQSAIEVLGLSPESIVLNAQTRSRISMTAGNEDVIAHIACHDSGEYRLLSDTTQAEYNLRGLLVDKTGNMLVGPKDSRGADRFVFVRVISTPMKLAGIMTQLGMSPGVDSLCPVEHDTEKSFKAIPYLRQLAVKNSAVSNRKDWHLFQHDIGIDAGHRPDLLTFSPEFVQVISDRASSLLENTDIDGVATLDMKRLVTIVDNFRHSRAFFQAVYDVTEPNRTRKSQSLIRNHMSSPLVELYRLVNEGLDDLEDPQDHSQEEYAATLRELGMLEGGLKRKQEIEATREVSLGFVRHSARLLLAVENLVPNPNNKIGESQRRMLEKVVSLV